VSRDAAGVDRWAPGLAWLLWALTLLGLAAVFWLDHPLRRAGRPELTIRAYELTYLAAMTAMATVGAVLAGRRPRHPVGWLMLALGLSVTVDGVTDAYARYGLLASPVAGIAIESAPVVGVAVLGSAVVLCLAIAAAILRYRLYDLDRS
jgi:hypothetical protein